MKYLSFDLSKETFNRQTVPADGAYAGWLSLGIERWPAAISIGTNPTFAGARGRQVEAYALDQAELDLYSKSATIECGWRSKKPLNSMASNHF